MIFLFNDRREVERKLARVEVQLAKGAEYIA
jgi:hypothetical protein